MTGVQTCALPICFPVTISMLKTSYIRLIGDLSMIEYVEMWEDGDKIRCIDDSEKNTLKLNEVYTVDTSMNTTDNRVYVKENKRFSFLKSRFELVEE